MDRSALSRRGLLPVGVISSSLPLLVLFGSTTFSSAQLAIMQLCVVWAMGFVSYFMKVTEAIEKENQPLLADAQPIKVELVSDDIDDIPIHPSRTKAVRTRRSLPQVREVPLVDPLPEQPQILESRIKQEDLVRVPATPQRIVPEHSLYNNAMLDRTLRNFLAVLDPAQLVYLPGSSDTPSLAAPVPLSSWEQMLNTPACKVAKHPTIPHLYSISASYPDVPLRNLWELMIDIKNRPKWDSMCHAAEDIDSMGADQLEAGPVRQAAVDYLATKGMFLVKANDMVLLSVNARLKPDGPLRLVCATTSVEHPTKPVYKAYSRMILSISGFVAEDDGLGGCRVTQLTDLSALGSWVPSRVIKMVTETMIPKSLVKIGETARDFVPSGPRALLRGEDWLPPVIGAWDQPRAPSTSSANTLVDPSETSRHRKADSIASTSTARSIPSRSVRNVREREADDDDESDSEDAVERMPASSSRELREVVNQLRAVNSRLSTLERNNGSQAPSASADSALSNALPNGHTGYHPPPPPFGVSKVTDNALTTATNGGGPMGWMGRIANTLNLRSFVGGLGAGIFSTTTAATLAAFIVYYIRKRRA